MTNISKQCDTSKKRNQDLLSVQSIVLALRLDYYTSFLCLWYCIDTTGPGTHLLPRPAGIEFGILYPRRTSNRGGGGGGASNDNNGNNDFDSGFNPDRNTFGNDNGGSSNGNSPAGSGPVGNGNGPIDRPLDRPSGNGPSDRPLGSNDNNDGPYGGSNNGDNDNSIDNDESSFRPTGSAANAGNSGNGNGLGKLYFFRKHFRNLK